MKDSKKSKIIKKLKLPVSIVVGVSTLAIASLPGLFTFVNKSKADKELSSFETQMISVLSDEDFASYQQQYQEKTKESYDSGLLSREEYEERISSSKTDNFKIQYGYDNMSYSEETVQKHKALLKNKANAVAGICFGTMGSVLLSFSTGIAFVWKELEKDCALYAASLVAAPVVAGVVTYKKLEDKEREI